MPPGGPASRPARSVTWFTSVLDSGPPNVCYPAFCLLTVYALRKAEAMRGGVPANAAAIRCPHPRLARQAAAERQRRANGGVSPVLATMLGSMPNILNRRVFTGMPLLPGKVRAMRHVITRGEKYGKLAVLGEVRKAGADGRRYRAALCRCECGKQVTPRISSLKSGDARSCGCSRGQPRYQWKHCPVCGTLALIRRGHRSCSRACGYQLSRAARQAADPSYDGWHHRVTKARGPASGYACVDCGQPAQDWSTVNPRSDDIRARFQPRCRKCHRSYDGATGSGNPRAKLTDGKVRQLRALRAAGLTYRQLAAEFGISDVSAWAAVNGRTWVHVS